MRNELMNPLKYSVVYSELAYEGESFKPLVLKNDTTDAYVKIFEGWDTEVSEVTSDTFMTAQWTKQYKLRVAGNYVTDKNCKHIENMQGYFKGVINYDEKSNTLTMENASVRPSADDTWGIFNQIPNLTIKIIGSNTVYAPKVNNAYTIKKGRFLRGICLFYSV